MSVLANWFPGSRRRAAEKEAVLAEEAITAKREAEADRAIRNAYVIAHKLASHRDENHFAQRINQAYRRRRHA